MTAGKISSFKGDPEKTEVLNDEFMKRMNERITEMVKSQLNLPFSPPPPSSSSKNTIKQCVVLNMLNYVLFIYSNRVQLRSIQCVL